MKDIIISSLYFMVADKRIKVYGFVLMPNRIHIIWQVQDAFEQWQVQLSFLRYTAQKMKLRLMDINPHELENNKVKASDRNYRVWERNPLSIELWSRPVFIEKLNYIHNNPVKHPWQLCQFPEEYKYSSAAYYESGREDYRFLTHYLG
jgi:putative transposase